ncbi:hypothetical protein FQA39_LY15735 [Lamprigera yunnana]|nr:hypothetical protein FQA39_LY15735 [Lamprigera yunnana]
MGSECENVVTSMYPQDLLSERLINDPGTIVREVLAGIVKSNPSLGLLNSGKVVVCRNYTENDIVKIVSGGVAGDEPTHARFVGKGMLSASIQGDIFHSSSVGDIMNTIKEINYKLLSGVLVIVQNNIPDRLSFGLAVERMRSQGIEVKLILVDDEFCAVNRNIGKRGLAGIVLVYKIAGAMAEQNCSLESIYQYCKNLILNISTITVSVKNGQLVDQCVCAGKTQWNELESQKEHGMVKIDEICSFVLQQLTQHFPVDPSTPIVILINNLGSALKIEEFLLINEVTDYFLKLGISISRVYSGKFMTSLNKSGLSITILRASDENILKYLDYPSEATGWGYFNDKPITFNLLEPLICRVSKKKRQVGNSICLSDEQANVVYYLIQFACDVLISCEAQLNIMDADGGNGNVGSKMKRGSEFILQQMQKKSIDFHYPFTFFEALSDISERQIGGGVGSFYGIFFEAAANYFRQLKELCFVSVTTWVECLEESTSAIKCYGNTQFGLGTMYDPLYACAETLGIELSNETVPLEAFSLAVDSAEKCVLKTKIWPRKHVDPGAQVVSIWMRALYEGLQLRFE